MSILSFEDQITSHLNYLRQNGLDVDELFIGKEVRCHSIGDQKDKRKEYYYKTFKNPMNKSGYVGIVSCCRVPGGIKPFPHRTYGLDGDPNNSSISVRPFLPSHSSTCLDLDNDISDAWILNWASAKEVGTSDYLISKGVRAYGVRFMENQKYGRVALVPAKDADGALHAIQYLNPNGVKRFPKGSKITGLFHLLGKPNAGQPIGIAESYVTAATCMELTSIPTVCAFNSDNLCNIAVTMRQLYPKNHLVIFADNDRHLTKNVADTVCFCKENIGLFKAVNACDAVKDTSLAVPDFLELLPDKNASDWNDLVRLKGQNVAKQQLRLLGL